MTQAPGVHIKGSAGFVAVSLFRNLDVTVGAGEWTCLLGVSGVGKSTILRLIAGLETGAVFDGSIETSDGASLDGRVAYMAQQDLLLPWATVLENVCLGARLRGERVDHARAKALIEDVGLTAHVAKKPHALSGGQRQRAALARTLMEGGQVILLDEPFSALDARTRADMQELAFRLLGGRTVLLVTHDPAEAARLGHRIVIMTEAGVATVAPPALAPPRPLDDAGYLAAQAALLQRLRVPA